MVGHVHDATLELRYEKPSYGEAKEFAERLGLDKVLTIGQYRGYGNKTPITEYYDLVSSKVKEFNETALFKGKADELMVNDDDDGDIDLG